MIVEKKTLENSLLIRGWETSINYYISSIIECIQMNMAEKKKVIADAVSYYQTNRRYIKVPKWQKLVFSFPVKIISNKLVYILFKIRNTKTA